LYHRTGLGTIRTLIKTGFKILHTGVEAKFRPFVDALDCGVGKNQGLEANIGHTFQT